MKLLLINILTECFPEKPIEINNIFNLNYKNSNRYATEIGFLTSVEGKKWIQLSVEEARLFEDIIWHFNDYGCHNVLPGLMSALIYPIEADILSTILPQYLLKIIDIESKFEINFTNKERKSISHFFSQIIPLYQENFPEDIEELHQVVKAYRVPEL